jgi:centromeric protein E
MDSHSMSGGGVQLLLKLDQEQKAQRLSQQHYLYPRPDASSQQQHHHQHHYQNQQFLSPQAHPPPSIPLPPLPTMTRTRGAGPAGEAASDKEREGAYAAIGVSDDLRARAATSIPRSVTSSPSIPTLRTQASSPSPSRVPTPNLRKAVSIEAFSRPPLSGSGSGSGSPLAQLALSSPRSSSQSSSPRIPGSHFPAVPRLPLSVSISQPPQPPRGLRKPQSKPSLLNLRSKTSTASLSTTAVSAVRTSKSDSLLSVPSPPGSRASSTPVSPTTPITPNTPAPDSTMLEAANADKDKETKGNITVSVRVRPDAAADTQPDGEWLVDGRRSLITYESGEYRYGASSALN